MSKKVFVDEYVEVWKRYTFEIPDEMDPNDIVDRLSRADGEPLEIETSTINFIEAENLIETEKHVSDVEMEVWTVDENNHQYELVGSTL